MKFKLIENSLNDQYRVKETVLRNRGINDWREYCKLDETSVYDYNLLDNINEAKELYLDAIHNDKRIHIVADADVDGNTSAAMIYRDIKLRNPFANVTYSLHTGKQHGLSGDIEIPLDCELLIIPDAGSNDVQQCKGLSESMNIIILDHHICDVENPYAVIVNNQMCDYPNKDFCGAGIVMKFLECVDEEEWTDNHEQFYDLCALGNISDVMDMRSPETKYYVEKGLSKIRSKAFKAFIEKQSYSMNGEINIQSVQFYITPSINAMIRVGSFDERHLLFRAFIETDEIFKYKKRGERVETDEDIYTRAARLCANAKSRQAKEVTRSVEIIEDLVTTQGLLNNKIIFSDVTNVLHPNLTGLVAIKIAEKFNRPCLLLRKMEDKDAYGGSCRNFDHSPVESLKEVLSSTGEFDFVQGHDNAAGFGIQECNIIDAIKSTNAILKDVDFTKCYMVDFAIDYKDLDTALIQGIYDMRDMFGQGVKEPLIHIANIPIDVENTMIMGKNHDTWKFTDPDNNIAYVKFTCPKSDMIINRFDSDEYSGEIAKIDVIANARVNNYKGILTPQIVINTYEESVE